MCRWKFGSLLVGSALLSSILCTPGPAATLHVGDTAPDFTLPEFGTGDPVSLYDYEGHVVLMDFFRYS